MSKKHELYMTSERFKLADEARHEEEKKAVVRLFIKHKQTDLLPMLGLSEDYGQHIPTVS